MRNRFLATCCVIAACVSPTFAQPKKDRPAAGAPSTKNTPQFISLFKPAVAAPSKSAVRLLIDGKEASTGTAIAADAVVAKASELIKAGKLTAKLADGKEVDAYIANKSDTFDLAVVEIVGGGSLTPIAWTPSASVPVGNWVAVAAPGGEPGAVGVLSVAARSVAIPKGPVRPMRSPAARSGFLGVQLDQSQPKAVVEMVVPDSAAQKAGIKAKDIVLLIDDRKIETGEMLIETLQARKVGDKVKVTVEREGKTMELTATLGPRPTDRGDNQNAMGSTLSDRRTGFPIFLQTDAVVKPADCGAPLVDLDGNVLGLMIARAGRTESYAIPSEVMKHLAPLMLSARTAGPTPAERVKAATAALAKLEKDKAPNEVVFEAKRMLALATEEEKFLKDYPPVLGPKPREVKSSK